MRAKLVRLWGIRHIRYLYYRWRLLKWWDEFGRYFWLTPNEADWRFLEEVWRGER